MRSMTGFGQGRASMGNTAVRVSIRTVNGRSLEVRVALPPELADLEPAILTRVRKVLFRGRVDVRVDLDVQQKGADERTSEALDALMDVLQRARTRYGIKPEITVGDLLAAGAMTHMEEAVLPLGGELSKLVEEAVSEALDAVIEFRSREGRGLRACFAGACRQLEELLAGIAEEASGGTEVCAARLRERVERLLGGREMDEATEERVAAEIVVTAIRADIEEEIQRAGMHLERLNEVLATPEGAIGKRIDFLLQELLRETNTMASKSSRSALTHRIVDAKSVIEQMREQAQNVE